MMEYTDIILAGAGAAGRYALRHLMAQGLKPKAFADNSHGHKGMAIEGVPVWSFRTARTMYPEDTWIACAISRPAAPEIRGQLQAMGVKTAPLWSVLPVCHGTPPHDATKALHDALLWDPPSALELNDQIHFRKHPDYNSQRNPRPISELYFPPEVIRLEDEHFVDCGAADGDTVKAFIGEWKSYKRITAFEPDRKNYHRLRDTVSGLRNITTMTYAIGDCPRMAPFFSTGDYSAHLAEAASRDSKGSENAVAHTVACETLDGMFLNVGSPVLLREDRDGEVPPTYIKMDIEGAELEALWGARKTIAKHRPVLAICAYHTSEHLWQIPLLIQAIIPDAKLMLRRYAEGAFEVVWYGIPPERLRQ